MGNTTTAVILVGLLEVEGLELLIDIDPQGSLASNFHNDPDSSKEECAYTLVIRL